MTAAPPPPTGEAKSDSDPGEYGQRQGGAHDLKAQAVLILSFVRHAHEMKVMNDRVIAPEGPSKRDITIWRSAATAAEPSR